MSKPRLVALPLPWRISRSIPDMRLVVSDDNRVSLELLANFRETETAYELETGIPRINWSVWVSQIRMGKQEGETMHEEEKRIHR